MDSTKNRTTFLRRSCLILLIFFSYSPYSHSITQYKLGTIKLLKGELFSRKSDDFREQSLKKLKLNDLILTKEIYSTKSINKISLKLFDGTWIMLGPQTKFYFESNGHTHSLTLLSGSLKFLFSSPKLENNKVKNFKIKTSLLEYQTNHGKFILSRKPILEETSLYVEKGLVQTSFIKGGFSQPVHQGEKLIIKDKEFSLKQVSKISDEELVWLNKSYKKQK